MAPARNTRRCYATLTPEQKARRFNRIGTQVYDKRMRKTRTSTLRKPRAICHHMAGVDVPGMTNKRGTDRTVILVDSSEAKYPRHDPSLDYGPIRSVNLSRMEEFVEFTKAAWDGEGLPTYEFIGHAYYMWMASLLEEMGLAGHPELVQAPVDPKSV